MRVCLLSLHQHLCRLRRIFSCRPCWQTALHLHQLVLFISLCTAPAHVVSPKQLNVCSWVVWSCKNISAEKCNACFITELLSFIIISLTSSSISAPDPPGQLRLHSPRAEWQHPLRLLLPRGAAGLLPGPGYDGHRHGDGVELRVHASLRGKLRRERRGGLHPDLEGNW